MRGPRVSRREFMTVAAGASMAAVVGAACGAGNGPPPASARTAVFRSRPDLHPPLVDVDGPRGLPARGFVFVTPGGPVILDGAGSPVWVHEVPHASANFRVQTYQGKPVLTWWEGEVTHYGVGERGEHVLMDHTYREIRRVRAGNGLSADLHEFVLTDRGTAYLTAYQEIAADLTAVKGPKKGRMLDSIIQEIDLTSGAVLFEWHSADHLDIGESYAAYPKKYPFDPVHINSIDPTADGNLLVSARNTWAIYKIDPATGAIVWRLGGKKGDFALGPGVRFAWQHDARGHPGNLVTLFDDEAEPAEAKRSRGLALDVDEAAMSATLVRAYPHPGKRLLADSQGSMQVLPNGDVLVGWGALPYYTEFRADGNEVLDARFSTGTSYRAVRFPWAGSPLDRPAVAVRRAGSGRLRAYASWNGATGVENWTLLGGSSRNALATIGAAPRTGFESLIEARGAARYVAVQAIDSSGNPLGTSKTVAV